MPKIPICKTLEEALATIAGGQETILEVHSHALIGDKGAAAIGKAVKESKVVEIIILPGQGIGPEGAAAIGQSLNQNTWCVSEFLLPLPLPRSTLVVVDSFPRFGSRPGAKHDDKTLPLWGKRVHAGCEGSCTRS